MSEGKRYILALLAAIEHIRARDDSGMRLLTGYTVQDLANRSNGWAVEDLQRDLDWLVGMNFVDERDTSYYGYGDEYIPGSIRYSSTTEGLVALWMV